jgi:hypothetical protein
MRRDWDQPRRDKRGGSIRHRYVLGASQTNETMQTCIAQCGAFPNSSHLLTHSAVLFKVVEGSTTDMK